MISVRRQFNHEFGDVVSQGVIVGAGDASGYAVSSQTVGVENVSDALAHEVPIKSFTQMKRSAVWLVDESQTSLVDASSVGIRILFHA